MISSVLGSAMEVTSAGVQRAYVMNGGSVVAQRNPNGQFYWLHLDHLGSGSKMTDSSGAMTYRAEFDPYGKLLYEWSSPTNLNTRKFTGYERDAATNLDYAQARMYASEWGRFMSPDPMGLGSSKLTSPQSLNRYSYTDNNPINRIDPTGTDWIQGLWYFTAWTSPWTYGYSQFFSLNLDIKVTTISFGVILAGLAAALRDLTNRGTDSREVNAGRITPLQASIGSKPPRKFESVGVTTVRLFLDSCDLGKGQQLPLNLEFTKDSFIEMFVASSGSIGGTEATADEIKEDKNGNPLPLEQRFVEVIGQRLTAGSLGGSLLITLRLRGSEEEFEKAEKRIKYSLVGFDGLGKKVQTNGSIYLDCLP